MKKVGIVGISGYSGGVLLELLLKHPEVRVTYVSANNTIGKVADIWPQLKGKTTLYCDKYNPQKAIKFCDLIFLAVPHSVASKITPFLIQHKKQVIDLSADYRLPNVRVYKKWYNFTHPDKSNLKKAVYGLPELYRANIRYAQLVANPGCYPTAAILGAAPIVSVVAKQISSIIIDAKSGVSGAGRKAVLALSFSEVNENLKAYKVCVHQHTPEIELYLEKLATKPIPIAFTPHLIPITRGIYATIYIQMKNLPPLKKIWSIYRKFYKREKFVRLLPAGQQPQIKHVNYTNYCDIAVNGDEKKNLLIVTVAIDNLMKGASGQAVQNMNIMCGYKENLALV